jgi:hypothetical protein
MCRPVRPGEDWGKGAHQRLPPLPQLCSLVHDAPLPLYGNPVWPVQPARLPGGERVYKSKSWKH